MLLAAAPVGAATACVCAPNLEARFLHAVQDKDHRSSIYLPLNARGVLFHAPASDTGNFTITEIETGKQVPAVVTALQSAPQVLRVGPQGGFAAGSSYRVSTISPEGKAVEADVRLGPALESAPTDQFALRADGPPARRLLQQAGGRCIESRAMIVQELTFALPPAYEPYRAAMTFFVQQRFENDYVTTHYYPAACMEPPFGGSSRGVLQELAKTECEKGKPRQARGLVGMLEMDDQLHETAVIELAFDKAIGPSCQSLKKSERRY
jgi:hypothetical protein